MYLFEKVRKILVIFIVGVGLWHFCILQAQELDICSYLQNQINGYPVCTSSTIDPGIINKINLKGRIGGSHISAISSVRFASNEDITEVDLSDNPRLTELPVFILDFPNLVHLDISNTGISNWRKEICQLKKLKKLIGRSNSYENNGIPFHTFCLESLRVLDVSDSNIQYIDEYIYYLQSLEELHIANNYLVATPFSLHLMPQLVLVDFTKNLFEDDDVNTLYSCLDQKDSADKEDCQRDLRSFYGCEWIYEYPYERGEPYRRYTLMTDDEYINFLERDVGRDICYNHWLKTMGGFDEIGGYDDEGNYNAGEQSLNAHLLERTINGKTIREWRLFDRLKKSGFNRDASNPFVVLYRAFTDDFMCNVKKHFNSGEYYLASEHEYFPEKEIFGPSPGRKEPEECK